LEAPGEGGTPDDGKPPGKIESYLRGKVELPDSTLPASGHCPDGAYQEPQVGPEWKQGGSRHQGKRYLLHKDTPEALPAVQDGVAHQLDGGRVQPQHDLLHGLDAVGCGHRREHELGLLQGLYGSLAPCDDRCIGHQLPTTPRVARSPSGTDQGPEEAHTGLMESHCV